MRRFLSKEQARRDARLQGLWPLGLDLLDHSGRGNHLTPVGSGTVPATNGRVSGRTALVGNGESYVQVPSYSFQNNKPMTLSAWVWHDSADEQLTLFSNKQVYGSGNWLGFDLTSDPNGQVLQFDIATPSGTTTLQSPTITWTQSACWNHVAFSYGGDLAGKGSSFYYNGRDLGCVVAATGAPILPAQQASLIIGGTVVPATEWVTALTQDWDGVTPPALPIDWSATTDSFDSSTGDSTAVISSPNAVEIFGYSTPPTQLYHNNPDTSNGNVVVSATFLCVPTTNSSAQAGVFCRGALTPTQNYCAAYIDFWNSRVVIAASENSNILTLATLPFSVGFNVNYLLVFTVNGDFQSLALQRLSDGYWLNSSGVFSATQATAITISVDLGGLESSGKFGIISFCDTTHPLSIYTDNFQLQQLEAAASSVVANIGAMALARVYNQTLSPGELASLYRREASSESYRPRRAFLENVSNSLTLYLNAFGISDSSATLFTLSTLPDSGSIPLYIKGANTATSGIPLFTWGNSTFSSGISLYTDGIGQASGTVPLFTWGTFHDTASMPLYLDATVPVTQNTAPLFLFGSINSGVYHGIPLYAFSDASGNILTPTMPLFLAGASSGDAISHMNLFVNGINKSTSMSTDLFLQNTQTAVASGMPLFIDGSGNTPGALPLSSSMDLFIQRWPAAAIPLFLAAPGTPISGVVPLYLEGTSSTSGSVPLVMSVVHGTGTVTCPLYLAGF